MPNLVETAKYTAQQIEGAFGPEKRIVKCDWCHREFNETKSHATRGHYCCEEEKILARNERTAKRQRKKYRQTHTV